LKTFLNSAVSSSVNNFSLPPLDLVLDGGMTSSPSSFGSSATDESGIWVIAKIFNNPKLLLL
jgi:hypothetical protein